MHTTTEHVQLRVLSENLTCSGVPIPKGEYEGYIDWEHPDGGEPRMSTVQLILDKSPTPTTKPCEVRQHLVAGDIVQIG